MRMQFKQTALKVRDFDLSVKAEDITDDGLFTGYGSVAGVIDSYNEVVAKGAFRKSLADLKAKRRKVPVLWQHRSGEPIGVYDTLSEDDTGLRVEGRLLVDHVSQAKEAHALMRAGAVTGLSIGYWVRKSSYDEKTGIRTLLELDLVEVSLVTFPANDEARIDAVKFKLAHGELPTLPEFERLLREAGFSKTKAAVVAAHGLPHLLRSESGGASDASGSDFLKALLAN
ncbi:HK97 family phage prohead protease [Novosphingobium profundi]|nr:HK97 family phage prohead protease [Novosphingobium profundi]